MLFNASFQKYLSQRPVAVMTRAALEHAFAADALNDLFARTAERQYTAELTFSTVVALLEAVVFRRHPSMRSAYLHSPEPVPVSLASVYEKLNRTELAVGEALVRHTAARLGAVCACFPTAADPVPGLRLRQLDGNHLAGTDRRLSELRGHGAAALPGLALAVRDDRSGLLVDLIGCEDAYAQERSLAARVLACVAPGQLWIADRNFAFGALFEGIAARGSYYVIRYHAGTTLHELSPRIEAGTADTGTLYEQPVRVGAVTCRSVVVRLHRPTADGDTEIRLLTNLSAEQAGAATVAGVYRRRWRIEGSFLELTTSLRCELDTLGYPKAALLGFALAVCACNVLRVVSAALECAAEAAGDAQPKAPARTGAVPRATPTDAPKPRWEASGYAVAVELRVAYDGLVMGVPAAVWKRFGVWSARRLADWLLAAAGRANRTRYRKARRGPKKPVERIKAGPMAAHRSTFRLLNERGKAPKTAP